MKFYKIASAFKRAKSKLARQPQIFVFGLVLYLSLIIFSQISQRYNYLLASPSAMLYFVSMGAIYIAILAYNLSGILTLANSKSKGFKQMLKDYFSGASKSFLKMFAALVLITLVSFFVEESAFAIAFVVGKALHFPVRAAQVLFISVYFAGLIGLLLFLTFVPVASVVGSRNFLSSIGQGIKFVKRNYLESFVLVFAFSITFLLVQYLPQRIGEIVENIILVPIVSVFMVEFFLAGRKRGLG
ncbi:hypothetical protein D6817_01615 [Candidatus Pacearchaeota archaeon]|nr:MAG: hypothetical protein D6817_01615 [Candidatus Pacearchaeota archaeon]